MRLLTLGLDFTVSIARRLQDPLTEYVRISPRHIGIGMYQHDISIKQLEAALEDIVR
jgi:transcriptional accessory protein Tex/SPT6